MKSTDQQFVNIDSANEHVTRLARLLGQTPPKFIPKIADANAKVLELEAELAKRQTAPAAVDVVVRPPAKVNAAPKLTDDPIPPAPKRKAAGYGVFRSINAAILATGGTPIAVRAEETAEEKTDEVTGLQRSINANIAAAKKRK